MAQYQDKMSAANLVGPPVGIEGTGQLTGALLEEPSAVVLLDEFEKAHPEAISDVLLSGTLVMVGLFVCLIKSLFSDPDPRSHLPLARSVCLFQKRPFIFLS